MDKITKLIQAYSDDANNQSTNSVFSLESLSPQIIVNPSKETKYHKQLVLAKIIISELQERCMSQENEINKHKANSISFENQLNEALSTIKTLHSDYKTLTNQFTKVNQSFTSDSDTLSIQLINLQKEINDNEQIYKINLHKLNSELLIKQNEIVSLANQLSNLQIQLKDNDMLSLKATKEQLTKDNFSLRKQIMDLTLSYDREIKESKCDIERLKSQISLNESRYHQLTTEIKEKEIQLQKQMKINEQYVTLDQRFTVSIQEKDKNYTNLNNQFNMLMNEHQKMKKEYEEKITKLILEINNNKTNIYNETKIESTQSLSNLTNNEYYMLLKKQKEYIERLLITIHPNGALIQQIVELHWEVLQLEHQKYLLEQKTNVNNGDQVKMLTKIRLQIQLFKNELKKHEIELCPTLNCH